jgi:hypothetical protein
MSYRLAAVAVLVAHALFVLFVALGGLLVLRWPRLAWLHLPAAAWGALIELAGWICPLTPLENRLRRLGGEAGYEGGFVETYVLAALYPAGLTREVQVVLGLLVLAVNGAVYAVLLRRRWRQGRGQGAG